MRNEDRRAVPRTDVHTPATMQKLGMTPQENGEPAAATVLDIGERGIRVETAESFAVGQAVKIEIGDEMFLGEVCHKAVVPGKESPRYHLGVVAKERLQGLGSLLQLIEALTPDPMHELERRR